MWVRRVAAASSLLALTACGALTGTGAGDATDGRIQVAASFYPLAFVAERVGGDHVDVDNLTAPGKEPHDLELSVQQTAAVASADLVVYETQLQTAVADAVSENAEGATLDAGQVVGLEPFEHDDHDDHAAEAEDEGDGHDHGELDPHFWLDPQKMVTLTEAVAQELTDLDADHATDYEQNAQALVSELTGLDTAYEDGLASCARDTIVVSHDAFGYWGRYGLRVEPIAGLSPDAEPTPADLARLERLIRTDGITTVFSETLVSPRLSRTLADDVGVRTAVLDPIEGLTDDTADQDYLSLMRANLTALQQANGC